MCSEFGADNLLHRIIPEKTGETISESAQSLCLFDSRIGALSRHLSIVTLLENGILVKIILANRIEKFLEHSPTKKV
jgi:hypothetical protein